MSLAISPEIRFGDEAGWWLRVRGAVRFRIGHLESTSDPSWTCASKGVPDTQTIVLSETRPEAGLTLLRVLRGGLELGECLGGTVSRANGLLETAPRTVVRGSGATSEGTVPHQGPANSPTVLAASIASDRSVLLASRAAG